MAARQILGGALRERPPAFPHTAHSTINATVHSPSCALVARYCELPSYGADGVEDTMQALVEAFRASGPPCDTTERAATWKMQRTKREPPARRQEVIVSGMRLSAASSTARKSLTTMCSPESARPQSIQALLVTAASY